MTLNSWTNPADFAIWQAKLDTAGTYEISAEVSATSATAIEFKAADQTLRFSVAPTGDYNKYTPVILGRLQLPAGAQSFELHAVQAGWHPANIKNLQLKPVAP